MARKKRTLSPIFRLVVLIDLVPRIAENKIVSMSWSRRPRVMSNPTWNDPKFRMSRTQSHIPTTTIHHPMKLSRKGFRNIRLFSLTYNSFQACLSIKTTRSSNMFLSFFTVSKSSKVYCQDTIRLVYLRFEARHFPKVEL